MVDGLPEMPPFGDVDRSGWKTGCCGQWQQCNSTIKGCVYKVEKRKLRVERRARREYTAAASAGYCSWEDAPESSREQWLAWSEEIERRGGEPYLATLPGFGDRRG